VKTHKGIDEMIKIQCDIEYKILKNTRCKNCGESLYPEEYDDTDLRRIFDTPFCSQGCAAEYHGYRGDAIL
jgi:formylmethanofuran dehydrogenase subunit E